jgi:C terminal of Calcineurin-like phosphoesterase
MLDNVDYMGADATRSYSAGKYEGRIGERQRAFIANVLRETPAERLVVAAMHIPLRNDLDSKDPGTNTTDCAEFLKLLAGRPNKFGLSGHTHTTEHHYFGAEDGFAGAAPHHHHVLTAVSGSWWSGPYDHRGIAVADSRDGSPNGFHILSVDGARYATRFQPANEPNGRQTRIVLDSVFNGDRKELYNTYRMGQLLGSPLPQTRVSAADLVVNLFDGGPRSSVEYRVGGRAPVPMQRTRRPDPFVEGVFARNEVTKKPWVKAEPSSHIFTARLPGDLEPGTHCVAVRAVDEYGREHRDYLIVEVTSGEDGRGRGRRS